jgi:hypothetical protein
MRCLDRSTSAMPAREGTSRGSTKIASCESSATVTVVIASRLAIMLNDRCSSRRTTRGSAPQPTTALFDSALPGRPGTVQCEPSIRGPAWAALIAPQGHLWGQAERPQRGTLATPARPAPAERLHRPYPRLSSWPTSHWRDVRENHVPARGEQPHPCATYIKQVRFVGNPRTPRRVQVCP